MTARISQSVRTIGLIEIPPPRMRSYAMLLILTAKPATMWQLAERAGYDIDSTKEEDQIRNTLRIQVARGTMRLDGNVSRVPAFRGQPGVDVPRVPAMTNAERQAAHMARVRADADAYGRHKARERARDLPLRADPLVAALFGVRPAQGACA